MSTHISDLIYSKKLPNNFPFGRLSRCTGLPDEYNDILYLQSGEDRMTNGSKPLIVCLCGSTDLMGTAFVEVNRDETLKGYVVLSVGVDMKDRTQGFLAGKADVEIAIMKEKLDWLHRRKIDMADVVIVLQTSGKELGES